MKRAFILLFLCSSCVQRYNPPPVKTPTSEQWKASQEPKTDLASCPEEEKVLSQASFCPWWKVFEDEMLNNLESQAIQNSPTVQAAIARLDQAYAFYGIELSSLFPQVTLDASASRQRVSKTQSFAGSGASSSSSTSAAPTGGSMVAKGPPTVINCPPCGAPVAPNPCVVCPPPKVAKPSPYVNQLALLPTLNYELDFWGKNWQATQSAAAQIKAEEEDVQSTLLILTTSVADAYLQVRTFDEELAILERTIRTRQNSFDLNTKQYGAGLINKLPVDQAKSDLESVKASLEEVKRERALAEHSLAELIGVPASIFTLQPKHTLPKLPTIPPGVPAAMLKRRPDIRQQENLITAAQYNVGVAKTEYFPDFTITLDYGLSSSKANKLFKWKSHTWFAAVDAVTPIFTAGRISSTIDQAIAQYKQQVASYINVVLISFQEVEDAIFSVDAVKRQLNHLDLQVVAATEAYNLADKRYRMGLENYLIVVDSERTMLEAERIATQIKRAQYTTTISLIKSLGGAWDMPN